MDFTLAASLAATLLLDTLLIGATMFEQQEDIMEVERQSVSRNRTARRLARCAIIACVTAFVGATGASAQITGSPVNSQGQAAVSGQPYVKTHKRHNKKFYGKHYNVNKYSKQ
jgi:hypothetical protein